MTIDVTDICKKPGEVKTVPVTSELSEIVAQDSYPIKELLPFDLTITNVAGKRLSVVGAASATVGLKCDRCLKEVIQTLDLHIERSYPIIEESVAVDEDNPSGVADGVLLPDELLQDEIILSLPSKVLCRDDCKGLCPTCGADLNDGDCGCERPAASLQMAKALENIRF